MANCNFNWSMCQTCSSQGSSQCPIENNRTIREIKRRLDDLEQKIDNINED